MDIGYTGAFFGGILTLFSPCSVMLLPAFFAYAFSSPTRLLGRTALFYAGLITTMVPLGVLAGTFGALVTTNRSVLVVGAAAIVIIIGILQVAGVRFRAFRAFSRGSATEGTSAISVFVLGSVYGVAGVCAGPILGSVLTVAAAGGNAVYGGMMLAIYALGMAVPLFVLALVWNRLKLGSRPWIRPRMVRVGRWSNSWWMIISGVLAIAIGVLLILTDGTAGLGGVFTIDAQFAAESWVLQATEDVPNFVFVLGAVAALVAVGVTYLVRARRPATSIDS